MAREVGGEWLEKSGDPEHRRLGTMTYAYLFKYIIIGDTGNPWGAAVGAGEASPPPIAAWGRGAASGPGEPD